MRILLLRTSALGDVVQALPVLGALRRHLPDARIAWVVEEWIAPLLAGHPDLDEIIPVRLRSWRKRPFERATRRELGESLRAIARFSPEVALDLMGNHKAGVLAALSFAERRLGFAREDRREPSSAAWINEAVRPRGTHAVDRMLSLLDGLGLPAEPADFQPGKIRPGEIPEAERAGAPGSEPFALVHPGAGWGNKRYPAARWGAVARELRQRLGLETRIAADPGDRTLAREVVEASEGAATVQEADIPEFVALARRAAIVLGGDSGPTHLAHALGRPVLMLMGPTDPAAHGPYAAPDSALSKRLPCSYCHRRFDETKVCLLEITPGEVAERAAGILRSFGF
ncbi:MAG TPA: glycosyltransferase family 9 protein [Thermoanaerobaculia bacterium]|nr:glycosyltransferase family 9 protein [Thermoanaerobaculia bacterium]